MPYAIGLVICEAGLRRKSAVFALYESRLCTMRVAASIKRLATY